MNEYSFSVKSRFLFYISYLFYKSILFSECKSGKARIYLAEAIWLLNHFLNLHLKLPDYFKRNFFITKFGKFYVVPDLVSTIAISPAFERNDVNFLLKLISKSIKKNRKVLFVDIGANIGYYSVIVGNKFKKNITILAFEPSTSYLSLPSYELLKKNIQVNKIKNIKSYKIGVGSENSKKKNTAGFLTKTLDSVVGKNLFKKYDEVFIKLDVDDFAIDALKGIQACVENGKNVTLLVEDFVDKKTPSFLIDHNYNFVKKLSDYNSFWKYDYEKK